MHPTGPQKGATPAMRSGYWREWRSSAPQAGWTTERESRLYSAITTPWDVVVTPAGDWISTPLGPLLEISYAYPSVPLSNTCTLLFPLSETKKYPPQCATPYGLSNIPGAAPATFPPIQRRGGPKPCSRMSSSRASCKPLPRQPTDRRDTPKEAMLLAAAAKHSVSTLSLTVASLPAASGSTTPSAPAAKALTSHVRISRRILSSAYRFISNSSIGELTSKLDFTNSNNRRT
mmetsp:Transcript_82559/g.220695  ORF Transcript_82559/g.220695 Transcript_82559/m.220695 type:complete len:232 (-) Transcript_82559:861-1556(-)